MDWTICTRDPDEHLEQFTRMHSEFIGEQLSECNGSSINDERLAQVCSKIAGQIWAYCCRHPPKDKVAEIQMVKAQASKWSIWLWRERRALEEGVDGEPEQEQAR